MMKIASVRFPKTSFLWVAGGVLLPPLAFGVYHFTVRPVPQMIQEMARAEGVAPATLQKIYGAMDDLSSKKDLKSSQWEDLIAASHDSNSQARKEAFGAIGLSRNTRFASQALAEVRRMASDPDPIVRDAYCWELYMLRAPDWKETAEQAVSKGDPAAQSSGKMALQSGVVDNLSLGGRS